MSQAEGVAPSAITPAPGIGRPTRALPFVHLLNLSVYWMGINAIWAGLGFVVYPTRFSEMFGDGLGPSVVTLFETIPVLFAVVVQPTVATISDYTITRWGRRKPYIVIGTLLDVVFLYGFASTNFIVGMFAFIMLLQFSSNFAQGPFQGYVPDLVPARQVGLASGLMGVMIVIGQAAGVFIAGIGLGQLALVDHVRGTPEAAQLAHDAFVLPTIALAAIEFATMIPLVLFVDEGRSGPARAGRTWGQIALSAWGLDILRERSYVRLLASRFFFLVAASVPLSLGLFYLRQSLGADDATAREQLNTIVVAVGVTTGLATLPAARLSDRIGRKRTIYAGIAIGTLGILLLVSAPVFGVTLAGVILIGLATGSFLAVDWALMTDIIPKLTAGRYMGISAVATGLAGPTARMTGLLLTVFVLVGLPAGADPLTQAPLSSTYEIAPRLVMLLGLVFFALSAWFLRHVDETRRED